LAHIGPTGILARIPNTVNCRSRQAYTQLTQHSIVDMMSPFPFLGATHPSPIQAAGPQVTDGRGPQ
jgi:hypothetical protein